MQKGGIRYREIVLPGEELSIPGMKGGFGTFERGGKIFSSCMGYVKRHSRAGYANIVPVRGRYSPRVGDKVVGRVVDTGPSSWMVDILAAYPAPIHVNDAPWRVEYGETGKFMVPGDSMLAQVSGIDDQRRTFLTMNQPGMKLIKGGRIVKISHTKVPRVIGRGGEMINLLKRQTNTRIFVGQNGLIWIDGELPDIDNVVDAVRIIDERPSSQGLMEELGDMLARRYRG